MTISTDLPELAVEKSAIFAHNVTSGVFRALKVNDAGELVVTTAGGGAPVDVSDRDARILGRTKIHDGIDVLLINADGSALVDPTDRAARDLGRVRIWDGTDVATVNALGALDVSVPDPTNVAGKGTAGAPSGGVLTIQGVTSMTPVQVGDNAGSLTVDQGTPANLQATVTPAGASVWDVSDRAARLLGVLSAGTNRIGSVRLVDNADAALDQAGGDPTLAVAQRRVLVESVPKAATLGVTATAVAGTGVTATLAAAGAGLFHYVTKIIVTKFVSVAQAGAATVLSLTATNLPVATIMDLNKLVTGQNVAGDMKEWFLDFVAAPLKSSVANTASTVVAPAFAGAIWRITVFYWIGP